MAKTLFHKVWDAHTVRRLPSGQTQLFIGLHLIHEVTSPQAFDMMRQHGWKVAFPERTIATIDHIVPTSSQRRPFLDVMAEEMTVALERNCREFGSKVYLPDQMDERMTICNMSIEGGARAGYVNPDDTTFAYLKGRQFAPSGAAWDKAVTWWRSMASDRNATYDDRVVLDAAAIEPTVTWGINPGQSVGVSGQIPAN